MTTGSFDPTFGTVPSGQDQVPVWEMIVKVRCVVLCCALCVCALCVCV